MQTKDGNGGKKKVSLTNGNNNNKNNENNNMEEIVNLLNVITTYILHLREKETPLLSAAAKNGYRNKIT